MAWVRTCNNNDADDNYGSGCSQGEDARGANFNEELLMMIMRMLMIMRMVARKEKMPGEPIRYLQSVLTHPTNIGAMATRSFCKGEKRKPERYF